MRGRGALIALLLLSGCIPRGGDTPVQSGSNANAPAAKRGPVVLIPEDEVVFPTQEWNPTVVERNAQYVDSRSYSVRAGDTLYRIGNETGAGAEAIASANGLAAPYTLQVGQRLTIPGGLYHRPRLWSFMVRNCFNERAERTLFPPRRTVFAAAQ
jgi:lipoprotein NlpD